MVLFQVLTWMALSLYFKFSANPTFHRRINITLKYIDHANYTNVGTHYICIICCICLAAVLFT